MGFRGSRVRIPPSRFGKSFVWNALRGVPTLQGSAPFSLYPTGTPREWGLIGVSAIAAMIAPTRGHTLAWLRSSTKNLSLAAPSSLSNFSAALFASRLTSCPFVSNLLTAASPRHVSTS